MGGLSIFLLFLLEAVICGALSWIIADKKGYSGRIWGIVGFFFSIFGLIAAAGLPPKKDFDLMSKILDDILLWSYLDDLQKQDLNKKISFSIPTDLKETWDRLPISKKSHFLNIYKDYSEEGKIKALRRWQKLQ